MPLLNKLQYQHCAKIYDGPKWDVWLTDQKLKTYKIARIELSINENIKKPCAWTMLNLLDMSET